MKNLLKYGLVMVLAMIASTGLLRADEYIEVKHDTFYVEKIDSMRINLCVEQSMTVHKEAAPKEEIGWLKSTLIFVKEYKKEIVLLFLLLTLIIDGIVFAVCRWRKKNTTFYKRVSQSLVIISVITLCVFSDSSWFYLVLVAILMIYINRENPELLNEIRDAIAALQGRNIPTEKATPKEIEAKHQEEAQADIPVTSAPPVAHPEKKGSAGNTASAEGRTLAERINARQNMHLSENVRKAINAEDLVIQMLREDYPNIETSRAIEVEGRRYVLDGFVQGAHENLIVEVKYMSNPLGIRHIVGIPQLLKARSYVQSQSRKPTFVQICVVTDDKQKKEQMVDMSLSPFVKNSLTNYANIAIYTFEELTKIISHETIKTTDFATFMASVDWNELNTMEKRALYDAAHGNINEKGIPFAVKAQKNSSTVELSYTNSNVVLLLNEAACKAFPKWLEDAYMNSEDGYAYLSYLEAMEKDD